MQKRRLFGLLLFAVCALPLVAFPQNLTCPKFSGAVKQRVEKQARWIVMLQGPLFAVNGVPLKSVVIRHQATWMMAVAPSELGGKMPDPNLLEITDEDWTLLYRNRGGKMRVVETGKYSCFLTLECWVPIRPTECPPLDIPFG